MKNPTVVMVKMMILTKSIVICLVLSNPPVLICYIHVIFSNILLFSLTYCLLLNLGLLTFMKWVRTGLLRLLPK